MTLANEVLNNSNNQITGDNLGESWIGRYSYFSACCLAVSVHLGVACVSISSLLVLIAFILKGGGNFSALLHRARFKEAPLVLPFIYLSLIWFLLSIVWTQVSELEALTQLMRYSRILVIPLIYFIITNPERAWGVVRYWVGAHLFVIASSFALWVGLDLPWAIMEDPNHIFFTPFTSSLEQPIMSSVVFGVIFQFRHKFFYCWGKTFTYLSMMAIVLNVCFLMQGRSGYIALLISIAFCIFWQIKARYRILAPLLPILIGITLFFVSNNFHQRVSKVGSELSSFGAGNIHTSVGTRLEFWTRSVQAIQIKPLVGFGVGSWPYAYKLVVSNDTGIEGANNPHEQFLLWTVEGGCVALILLICFYASIFKDASSIQELEVSRSLKIIFFILLVVSLFNCPLHGAGMSEFFCIIIALMLCMKKNMVPANNS